MLELAPFVKWAGGKRQLLDVLKQNIPEKFGTYYEPFIGGGALLFELQPNIAVVNDTNKSLINTYINIRDYPEEIISLVNKLDKNIINGDSNIYYSARDLFNHKLLANEYDIEQASLFIFLNKHCFNGLYRVNKKGQFNVPYNKSSNVSINEQNIKNISRYLQNVHIYSEDFMTITANITEGDFVFFDSPYDKLDSTTFTTYTSDDFTENDQRRLAKEYKRLSELGVYCLATNYNTELINELYSPFHIQTISVKRSINRDGNNRTSEEVIIKNF